MMSTRRQQLIVLGALVLPFNALAQKRPMYKVGYLTAASQVVNASRIKAFRQSMQDQGFIEGRDYVLEIREAKGNLSLTPGFLAELIAMKVDVIVTAGPADTKAAKAATSTMPIVMSFDPDPVSNGYAASLSRPGGNITGLSTMGAELGGKQLSLLKQIDPRISRVAIFGISSEPGNEQTLKELETPAKLLGITLQILDVPNAAGIEPAYEAAVQGKAQAALALQSPNLLAAQDRFIAQASKHRLPVLYVRSELATNGGLISYGPDLNSLSYTAAIYVVKILKGAKPGDLPVEQPIKFEMVLNLKAAKAMKINIPQSVLVQVDRIIE
jgi:putative ABC transport system substrate-binding protein